MPMPLVPRHTVGALLAVALAITACGLVPVATPSLNEKIAWTGRVFELGGVEAVEELMSQDEARALVAAYPQTQEIVALHAGRLAPEISGPSYLGYVAEVRSVEDGRPMIILVNAETQELAAAGLIPSRLYE